MDFKEFLTWNYRFFVNRPFNFVTGYHWYNVSTRIHLLAECVWVGRGTYRVSIGSFSFFLSLSLSLSFPLSFSLSLSLPLSLSLSFSLSLFLSLFLYFFFNKTKRTLSLRVDFFVCHQKIVLNSGEKKIMLQSQEKYVGDLKFWK